MKAATLTSRGMLTVLFSQFVSAAADNALLFGAIALLKQNHYPAWATPLLQEFFVFAYIVLAPFVGAFADALSKGRVMLFANGLKLAGAAAMLAGLNPLLSYGLVGMGAASYSPAKYGILSELTTADRLVKANGLMEASTIAAILIGAVAGGLLADWSVTGALLVITVAYAVAAVANLLIPKLPPTQPVKAVSLRALVKTFFNASKTLGANPRARFSLAGTSLFWGAGATLRFLLVAWVPVALGVTNTKMPANLNAAVAIGIVLGATIAARFIDIGHIRRALPAGLAIGALVTVLAFIHSLPLAILLLVAIGACGGAYVVPLNALLQEEGHASVGVGQAVAQQNFWENIAMLLLIGLYTGATALHAPVSGLAAGFGALLLIGMHVVGRQAPRPPMRDSDAVSSYSLRT